MTQSEFTSQLDDMKKRGRKLMAFVWVVVIALAVAAFWWVIFYRPKASSTAVLISGAVYMLVWCVSGGVLVFYLKRHTALYSPKCPTCNKSLTWRERPSVLTSKQCPFCHAQIIYERGV
jgi:hypothetical protein